MQCIRSLIVGGSLVLSAVAIVPAQQPTPTPAPAPTPGARARRFAHPGRGRQADKALFRGIMLSDAEKTNIQAVRAKYATQMKSLRTQLRTQSQSLRAARQRGDTAAAHSIRASIAAQRMQILQSERNDLRAALSADNQAKFDANAKAVQARVARKALKGRRQSGE